MPDVLVDPRCSWETTIPMNTVAPVAAKIAPRVTLRSRDRAFSLLSGVFGGSMDAMVGFLWWGTPSSEHRRIDPLAGSAVGLL